MSETDAEPEPCPVYLLDVVVGGLRVDIFLNDWLAYSATTDKRRSMQHRVNQFIVEGTNTLRVDVARSPTVPPEPKPDEAPDLDFRFVKGEFNDSEKQRDLYRFQWFAELNPLPAEGAVTLYRHEFDVIPAFGEWKWQKAKPYDDRDRAGALQAIAELHRALQQRDPEAFINLQSIKIEEMARSVREDVQEYRERELHEIRSFMKQDEFVVQDPPYDELIVRSSAGGRLVEVLRRDGTDPLKIDVGPMPIDYPVMLSCIDGSYRVVR